MYYVNFLFCITGCIVSGMKVDMQGSFSLGKDVMDTLSFFLSKNVISGRRSLMPPPVEDPITLAVRTALLCKDIELCHDNLQTFLDEYIIILAKALESLLIDSDPDFITDRFEEQLKYSLEYIRNILEESNGAIDENNEAYHWIRAIKKINSKFQEVFTPEENEVTNESKISPKRTLTHKIVIATTFIERKYEIKLCADHDICSKSHECTQALNKILIHFKTLPEDKIRIFIKYFYESLFDSSFYSHISGTTANKFQEILNDMAYTNTTPTKDLMLSVQKTVEARLKIIQENKGLEVAHDILIAHVILSDMDHMFSKRKDPFISFLNHFYDWLASDKKIDKPIDAVLLRISKGIWSHDEDLVLKLIHEVKVFLEMTVGPEE